MWLIIGVSGATCSGKSTLAQLIHKALPGSSLICQDDFFLPVDSGRHTLIPALNHFNWEIMSSLDVEKMHATIENILSSGNSEPVLFKDLVEIIGKATSSLFTNETGPEDPKADQQESSETCNPSLMKVKNNTSISILIIEGFLIFNDKKLAEMCHLKYFLKLTREECWARRSVRAYDPPDVSGYFDQCVWPEYEKHRDEVFKHVSNVTVIDGTTDRNDVMKKVFLEILKTSHMLCYDSRV